MTNLNDYLQQKLTLIEAKHQLRKLPTLAVAKEESLSYIMLEDDQKLINFSSNDYLGLSRHPQLIEAAINATKQYGTGARAARLIGGHSPDITKLEQAIAEYRNSEAALVFSSGYATNTGTISALIDQNDLVIADKLSHACLLDGARLSGATLHRFGHNNVEHLEKLLVLHRDQFANCLLVTESIFSMDGDMAPIESLIALAKRYNCWLLVDDAHGAGFSQSLLKTVSEFDNGIITGTLSKAIGALGGYVAGTYVLKDFLVNHARSFMFSTALPPATIAAALKAFEIISTEPELANTALQHAKHFAQAMNLPEAQSPIVPYIVGENEKATHITKQLLEKGIYVHAIRPPTVPPGTARLRITFTASHIAEQIDRLITALKALRDEP